MENRLMTLLARWFRRSATEPSWIDAAAVVTRVGPDVAPLVDDVRGHDEFIGPLGHIEGAINLPLSELQHGLPELAHDDRPVVVVCKTDRRSSIAAHQLLGAGVSKVSVLRARQRIPQSAGPGMPLCGSRLRPRPADRRGSARSSVRLTPY